jgi:hypothetical protein
MGQEAGMRDYGHGRERPLVLDRIVANARPGCLGRFLRKCIFLKVSGKQAIWQL